MSDTYQISLPAFNGPLDLLLHLIERQEFDITTISLLKVTEQYLEQIEHMKESRLENLIDFLVVAARLVQIKSRALLPQTPVFPDEEEEDPAAALVRQLRQYKRFKRLALWLHQRETDGFRTYLRVAPPPKMDGKLDLTGVSVATLQAAVQAALARVVSKVDSVDIARPRRITIASQIDHLRLRLTRHGRATFLELLPQQSGRLEIAVTLLAMLELIKRRELTAEQPELFGPIEIKAVRNDEVAETPNRPASAAA